jgi:hypothetical protein
VTVLDALQAVTAVVVAIAMSLALAHALELPGKMRLQKEHYLAMQPIYYPGFTYAAFSEPLGLVLLAVMLFLVPAGSTIFWLTLASFAALLAMHVAYWLLTHPVNKFWLKDYELKGFGRRFFGLGKVAQPDPSRADWTDFRNRWEYSHAIRAALGLTSFALLVLSLVL